MILPSQPPIRTIPRQCLHPLVRSLSTLEIPPPPLAAAILIRPDLSSSTFWEYLPPGVSKTAQPGRILRPSRKTHHGDIQVSPQQHQWLKQTRADAPIIQEQIHDVRIQELQINTRLAEQRWEAKARYSEKPKAQDSEVSAQRKMFGGVDEVNSDGPTAMSEGMPRTGPEHKEGVRTAVDTQIPKGKDVMIMSKRSICTTH